jgi:hypothetical protein
LNYPLCVCPNPIINIIIHPLRIAMANQQRTNKRTTNEYNFSSEKES